MATQRAQPSPRGARQSAREVSRVISRAAYFTVYSLPDFAKPEVDDLLIPDVSLTTFKSYNYELGHRFRVNALPPSTECGIQATRTVGEPVINNTFFTMAGIPNYYQPNFEGGPGSNPPPTIFLPGTKTVLKAEQYAFDDGLGTEMDGIGVARFYAGAGGALYIGGVGDMNLGKGQLQGVVATLTVNGYATHPPFFANEFVWRVVEPAEKFISKTPLPPIEKAGDDPESDSVIFRFLADLDPGQPPVIEPAPDGNKKLVKLVERLRFVELSFEVRPSLIRTHLKEGEVVGERRTTLVFDPDDPQEVTPLYSKDSVFKFQAGDGKTIGTLNAEIADGRAMRTTLPELENPYHRIAGYGPLGKGTGQFVSATGLLSCNGALSLSPGALSTLYSLRIFDPLRRFQPIVS